MIKKNLLIILCLVGVVSVAQKKTDGTPKPVWKRDTVIAGNVFKIYSNWINIGLGLLRNPTIPRTHITAGVDLNFHITNQYFQVGAMLAGEGYGIYSTSELHLCYGKRTENRKYNCDFFGGLSYSTFNAFSNGNYATEPSKEIGVYGMAQAIRKITYDVGIGISAFAEINSKQSMFGLRLDLYFSGAYKGKKKDE